MILIADSGSTKCDWVSTGAGFVCRTPGINAALHTPAEVRDALASLPCELHPDGVCFYGAGCGESFPAAGEALRTLLAERFGSVRIEVQSDLLGAARALLGRGTGVACILGTGSNSGYYDGRRIVQNVPPLGYILGDEGSGAALGRQLLNGLLKGVLDKALRDEFYRIYKLDYEGVICRVYRKPRANRFLASLTPFIREHLEADGMRALVRGAFAEFAERNLHRYSCDEVSFTGGVAAAFEEDLRAVMAHYGYRVGRVTASPAQGLIEYHERE